MPQIVTATNDGFLYVSSRSSGVEAQDEGRMQYEVRHERGECIWGVMQTQNNVLKYNDFC